MKVNSDFKDMLRSLNAASVWYLVVGGYAWMVHNEPRYTKDIDVWIEPVESNAKALFTAMAEFGAPTVGITPADFTEPKVFFQIGVEPVRYHDLGSWPGF
jgi:hypothetical protein